MLGVFTAYNGKNSGGIFPEAEVSAGLSSLIPVSNYRPEHWIGHKAVNQ